MIPGESEPIQSPAVIRFNRLSSRELEILKLVVEGHSNPVIATALYLSLNAIKTHVRSMMNKRGVDRRIQLAVVALQFGLL